MFMLVLMVLTSLILFAYCAFKLGKEADNFMNENRFR